MFSAVARTCSVSWRWKQHESVQLLKKQQQREGFTEVVHTLGFMRASQSPLQ